MRLVLFDVDGTLIHANRAGRIVLAAALTELFGTPGPIESYSMAGKTDSLVVHDLLGAAGFSPAEIKGRLQDVYEEMAWHAPSVFRRHTLVPCAGVPALLNELRQLPDVLLGLLTGNNRLTAPLKLQAAGIDPGLFALGAYGCDYVDRNRLPAVAIERARDLMGDTLSAADTVIVGDTPADVICGRTSGALSVAVATGGYSAETLAAYHPDVLLADLADTTAVVSLLTNHTVLKLDR